MPKHAVRQRRERKIAGPAAQHPGSLDDRLARLFDTPHLARLVPHLAPEALHQVIRHRGLDACGELLVAATPEQLTSVFDLDLWRHTKPGRDEQFDDHRFGEWLELWADSGDPAAFRTLAAIDQSLVVAGLSRYIRVFDPGTFESTAASDDELMSRDELPSTGVECEVGGYVVRARRADTWDAVVALLLALDADHGDYFHAVMSGCRRLSNSTPESDGLDSLLGTSEQQLHDVALERERRRTERGFSTPADARAFLEMARQPGPERAAQPASINPLAAAYFRDLDEAAGSARNAPSQQQNSAASPDLAIAQSLDAIADLLAEAGLVPERPKALLPGTTAEPSRPFGIRALMDHLQHSNENAYFSRSRELAFLVNTLMAGGAIQSRPFSAAEASAAAVATCDLGLEHWPSRWPGVRAHDAAAAAGIGARLPDAFLVEHGLVTAFEVGWAVLHRDVSLFVADVLIEILADLRCIDEQIQDELKTLRRELVRQRAAGTPWRARHALEVIAMLDPPAWASLLGLLDECPVLPAALTATRERRTGAVSATAFEFISTAGQIAEVRAFMRTLPDLLLR